MKTEKNKEKKRDTHHRGVGSGYWGAIGSAEQSIALAQGIGQRWLKGLRLAQRLG